MYFLILSTIYVLAMVVLLLEFQNKGTTPEKRCELQSIPLMIGATLLFFSLIRFGLLFLPLFNDQVGH